MKTLAEEIMALLKSLEAQIKDNQELTEKYQNEKKTIDEWEKQFKKIVAGQTVISEVLVKLKRKQEQKRDDSNVFEESLESEDEGLKKLKAVLDEVRDLYDKVKTISKQNLKTSFRLKGIKFFLDMEMKTFKKMDLALIHQDYDKASIFFNKLKAFFHRVINQTKLLFEIENEYSQLLNQIIEGLNELIKRDENIKQSFMNLMNIEKREEKEIKKSGDSKLFEEALDEAA